MLHSVRRRLSTVFVAALLFPSGTMLLAPKGDLQAFQEDAAKSADSDLAELKVIAKNLVDDPKSIQGFRPTWKQSKQIAGAPNDAAAIYKTGFLVFNGLTDEGLKVKPNFTDIEVIPCDLSRHCNAEIRKRLTDHPLYQITYGEKDGDRIVTFFVFAKIDGRWAFFLRPWDTIKNAKTIDTHPGTVFVQMLARELYDDAYDLSAPAVHEVVTREKFEAYFRELNLNQVDKITWRSTSRERKNSEQALIYEGQLTYFSGTVAQITLTFIFDGDEGPKPFRLDLTRQFGATDSYAYTPSRESCQKIARDAVEKLVAAIEKNDFEEFRETNASHQLKQAASAEDFKSTFAVFVEQDLSFVKDAKIKFSKRPLYGAEFGGCLLMEGSFRSPEKGKVLSFTMNATEDFQKWKLNAINLYPLRDYDPNAVVPKMSQDAVLELASETTKTFMNCMASGNFSTLHQQLSPSLQPTLTPEALKASFVSLSQLFAKEGLFHDQGKLDIRLRTAPSMDEDFLKVSLAITEPGDEWIQGDLEYVFADGRWQILRISYRY